MAFRYSIITVDPDEARTMPNLALRQISQPVDPNAESTAKLIEGLFDLLEHGPQRGVGLSAPQVGILARVFVVNIQELRKRVYVDPKSASTDTPASPERIQTAPLFMPVRMAVVNPVFTELSDEMEKDYEGCLSIPAHRGPVPRHSKLRVQGFNEHGEAIDIVVEGFVARVFQHEYDHLDGILYVDRMDQDDVVEAVVPSVAPPENKLVDEP